MEAIHITDVSARDGIQNQSVAVDTASKLKLIDHLVQAGVGRIEATSFVSPRAVPQMADAAAVMSGLGDLARNAPQPVQFSVLVPNLKGLERALASGATEVAVVLSATEEMNLKNINMGLRQAAEVSEATILAAQGAGIHARAYVAVAWECPFEGPVDEGAVIALAERMVKAGAREVVIADTIGAAAPLQVGERLRALVRSLPAHQLAVHFHDTRGFGAANAFAALEAGIRRFDASVGGIGGCPFAPGAAGNIATEDLVLMAQQCGFSTGIQLQGLVAAVDFAQDLLGQELGGHSMRWLRRQIGSGRPLTYDQ